MDNKNTMQYRARSQVALAMADPRTCQVMSMMLERRPALLSQGVDTAYLAAQIAEAMDYQGDRNELVTAALVHDAGMLTVPDSIVMKKGRLDAGEREAVHRHALDGATMLAGMGFPEHVLEVVRMHHERSDGSGYPFSAVSPDIPRAAKIVMVCDVYEALTSDRPQRKAFNMYEACSMMAEMPISRATLQAIKLCNDV